MTVGRMCIRDVDTATGDESALMVARWMRDRNAGTLVIMDDENHPMEMLSRHRVA